MKVFLLDQSPFAYLRSLTREHFIQDRSNFFFSQLAVSSRIPEPLDDQLKAALFLQIDKIIVDNIYRYLRENNMHGLMTVCSRRHFGMDIYIPSFYATEVLEPLYRFNIPEIDHDEVANDLIAIYLSQINHMYAIDSERFNRAIFEITEYLLKVAPVNMSVMRFELTPRLQFLMMCREIQPVGLQSS